MFMGGESHTHRQVASTMLSIESSLLHRLTPEQSVHVTKSRAIASRCPKLRTSKGHLVYKRPPTRSHLSYRKPTLRHARYNHTRNIHVQCEQQVSSHYSTKCIFIDLHKEHTRPHGCDQHYIIQRKQI